MRNQINRLLRALDARRYSNEEQATIALELWSELWECYDVPGDPFPAFEKFWPRHAAVLS